MQQIPEIGSRVRYVGPTQAAYHASGEGVIGTVVDLVPLYRTDAARTDIPRPRDQWHVRVAVDDIPGEWSYVGRMFNPKVSDVEVIN
ncbi:MAG: hypothetical protein AAGJ32_05535 [Pseudomonadota bacterium]